MKRGFTIVETLVSGLILGIIFLAIFSLFPASLLALRKAHDLTNATTLGQTALETARTQPFASLQPGTTTANPSPVVDGTTFTLTTSVVSESANVMHIGINVSWSTGPQAVLAGPMSQLNYDTKVFNFENL